VGVTLAQWLNSNTQKSVLPWEIKQTASGATEVFGLHVGQLSLKDMMKTLHKIAEINAFEDKNGQKILEAYFAKVKLGVFDAILIAELDIKTEILNNFIQNSNINEREATPSGRWKYVLNEANMQQVNQLRVWRLIYIPVAEYNETTLNKQFGKPNAKQVLDDNLSYWYYPKKGLAILHDKSGSEIFYYVAPNEFTRLKTVLPKQKQEIN
jgi:hypothetical protein